MSDTYSYEVLEPGGHARLVGNVLDRISEASANPASAVGSSRAMLGDAETASWMERTTAADGAALIEAVQGRTLRWNQLARMPFGTDEVRYGVTFAADASGLMTLSGTSTQTVYKNIVNGKGYNEITVVGHKYLVKKIGSLATADSNIQVYNDSGGIATGVAVTVIGTANASKQWFVRLVGNIEFNGTFGVQIFDLTQMFGAGNEPSTVAEFEALYPKPYYPYDPGSLLPVRMDGIETVAADESWSSQRTIPASTYFPDGLRSAGTVYDELRADAAITRVGSVDLGTHNWNYVTSGSTPYFYTSMGDAKFPGGSELPNVVCSKYEPRTWTGFDGADKVIAMGASRFAVVDSDYTDAVTFKTAMSGVMLHYAIATPTTTPIDPPLALSYRTGAGGTERVMVASGTTSAPPIFATRYPLDPADLAASIAPVDGPIAKTNHQVGDLLMLGFTLCKVTTAIARGEAITIGTNVTLTSVAAEIAALS